MNIEDIQKKIDATEYWDLEIINFEIKYFGDEINLYIYDTDETSWKIIFSSCYQVQYETDANWRTIENVKNMKKPQLGYYGQDISINFDGNFICVKLDLTIMTVNLKCRNIEVENINNSEIEIFWKNN